MVSFIVIAKEKKKRETYVKEYAKKNAIDAFDITIIEKDATVKPTAASIGIETIKLMQKKLYFKPIRSAIKLIILEDAHLLTPEAQNALLKVLEEPPANTHIMLGTETKEALLPTILSRCQIIPLEEEQRKVSEKTLTELSNFVTLLPELSIGDRLKQAELLAKDKEKTILWIENLILVLREQLLATYNQEANFPLPTSHFLFLTSFRSLHKLLKTTNVNPRFAIEHTLLNI